MNSARVVKLAACVMVLVLAIGPSPSGAQEPRQPAPAPPIEEAKDAAPPEPLCPCNTPCSIHGEAGPEAGNVGIRAGRVFGSARSPGSRGLRLLRTAGNTSAILLFNETATAELSREWHGKTKQVHASLSIPLEVDRNAPEVLQENPSPFVIVPRLVGTAVMEEGVEVTVDVLVGRKGYTFPLKGACALSGHTFLLGSPRAVRAATPSDPDPPTRILVDVWVTVTRKKGTEFAYVDLESLQLSLTPR